MTSRLPGVKRQRLEHSSLIRLTERLREAEASPQDAVKICSEVRQELERLTDAQHQTLSLRVRSQPENPFNRLLPLMRDKGNVVLCSGVPPDAHFPIECMDLTLKSAGSWGKNLHVNGESANLAQRYAPFAWGPLKQFLECHMRQVHSPVSPDWSLAIAAGSMSSVDLSIGLLLDRGDAVFVEEFTFLAAIDAFQAAGVRLVSVSCDKGGLRPEALQAALDAELAEGRCAPKALYTIPVGQNPLGTRLHESRYSAIYEICKSHHITIIEDDAYFYQQHNASDDHDDDDDMAVAGLAGLTPQSFLTVDSEGLVLRLDTFSKVLAPGFRLGWVSGAKKFVEAYEKLAYVSSQNGSSLSMVCVSAILQHWGPEGFECHLRSLQLALRKRCRALLRACEKHLDGWATWQVPSSGMFLWLHCTKLSQVSDDQLLDRLRAHGVVVMPGSCCSARREEVPFVRISFVMPENSYDEGMRRLRLVLEDRHSTPGLTSS